MPGPSDVVLSGVPYRGLFSEEAAPTKKFITYLAAFQHDDTVAGVTQVLVRFPDGAACHHADMHVWSRMVDRAKDEKRSTWA